MLTSVCVRRTTCSIETFLRFVTLIDRAVVVGLVSRDKQPGPTIAVKPHTRRTFCGAIIAAACVAAWAVLRVLPSFPTTDRKEFRLAQSFADELDRSNGLVAIGHERAVKAAIATRHRGSCFVIGSSRVMTVRASMISVIDPACTDTFNLGVSGATLEDDIAFAELSTGARAIFFGLDHWSLKFDADDRFTELLPAYQKARCDFGIGPCTTEGLRERTRDAMAYIIRLTERTNFRAAESRSDGEATTLRDASHVYSAKYLREMRGRWNEAHLSYKLSKPFVQEAAVVDFQTMLDALVQSGTKVYLILMPYHPRAAGCESQELCEALRASEAAAKHIAAKTHIPICGSFFSDLRSEDFVSDMFVDPAAFNLQEPCR